MDTTSSVTSRGWTGPPSRPAMANELDVRDGLELTDRGLRRDGRGWIPVSGELHYSRVPRERWAERVRQVRAGGIDVVSTYVPWIHHVAAPGDARFDGGLDVGAFVDVVRAEGLDVVLRIGPWVHGEIRNGGLPDWVQAAPVRHRTNDPAYLDLVRTWFGQLAGALDGRGTPATVLAIQLENELDDRPDHLLRLKRLAREAGMSSPIWTATAWGGARLPRGEVLPLFGGYADGFWLDADEPWHPSFRAHFFFSHVWDDPGIGADVRPARETDADDATDGHAPTAEPAGAGGTDAAFPPATCELGGGMATAYHRRPWPSARDVAAVAHTKIGNGSTWQGYYMYAGGTNPGPDLQESHASGYPNDLAPLGYDFHAPVAASGRLRGSHALLRRQHAFLGAFADLLATMPSHLPDVLPAGVEDRATPRWAVRGNDESGFLLLNAHQPYEPVGPHEDARFTVAFPGRTVTLPSTPVVIPQGTMARWPVGLAAGGVTVEWATASVLTLLAGPVPVLVLVEDEGIAVEVAVRDGGTVGVRPLVPGRRPHRIETSGGRLDVLVVPAAESDDLWVQAGDDPDARRLLLSPDEVTWDVSGLVSARTPRAKARVLAYDVPRRSFEDLPLALVEGAPEVLDLRPAMTAAPGTVPSSYGSSGRRASAPDAGTVAGLAATFVLDAPAALDDPDACLEIDWAGDVAQLVVDGEVVDDQLWDGSPWLVSSVDRGVRAGARIELRLLPLSREAPVHLPPPARARLRDSAGQLLALDAVRLSRRALWRERRAAATALDRRAP